MPSHHLLQKYNIPVPRYTSYPTVPVWTEGIDVTEFKKRFIRQFAYHNQEQGISLYIHLPFCESLCTYCGCNKKVTTNHSVEEEYMVALQQEWALYLQLMPEAPVIRELHLGGGTPTFFSPANLEKLMGGILGSAMLHPDHEFSFEGHPNNTTGAHLRSLYNLGFRRLSLGVQDNDPEVQRIINRIQPLENVQLVTELARKIGYTSVNYDLIYGLPRQTLESVENTIAQTIALRPDRIAFYSYAHVPWTSKGQRLFDIGDLPSADEKLKLYQHGRELLLANGYHDIGMDHFSLPTDDLYQASKEGRLHRNFMGYTTQHTSILVGLGVSSIGGTGNCFVQNAKTLHNYYEHLKNDRLPIEKGYFLSEEDVRFGQYILDISCRATTTILPQDQATIDNICMPSLLDLQADGLIVMEGPKIMVTKTGRNFIRNICSAFDLYLPRNTLVEEKRVFSNAI